MEVGQTLHRYEGTGSIAYSQLKIIKVTNAGVWVDYYGQKKFVLNYATKKFAYPTKGEAMKSWLARKRKQLAIYKSRVSDIVAILAEVETQSGREYLDKFGFLSLNKITISHE